MHERTQVTEVVSSDFKDRVLEGEGGARSTTRKCVVEIYKNDCDACHYNAKMYDIISNKLSRYGYLDDKVSLYRMNLDNISPYLGRFLYAPQYIYLDIVDGQIRELKTLRNPSDKLDCTTFLEDL